MKKLLLIVVALLLIPKSVWSYSYTRNVAAPCGAADVQAAITDARTHAGDVLVSIPNCQPAAWNASVSVNMVGANCDSLTIQGQSKTGTMLTNPTFLVTNAANKFFRLSNFNFVVGGTGNAASSAEGFITMNGRTKYIAATGKGGFRVDNINLDMTVDPKGHGSRFVSITANGSGGGADQAELFGVIDHIGSAATPAHWCGQFSIVRGGARAYSTGNYPWYMPETFGSTDAVYLQDSVIANCSPHYDDSVPPVLLLETYIMDNESGSKVAIRDNTFSNYNFGGHDYVQNSRGARGWEVYRNVWKYDATFTDGMPFVDIRGGTGYIFDNYAESVTSRPFFGPCDGIMFNNVRSWVGAYSGTSICDATTEKYCFKGDSYVSGSTYNKPCSSDADCDSGYGTGACQPADMNLGTDGSVGYPCRDQVGRGQDLGYSGSTYLGQRAYPALIWNNTVKMAGAAVKPVVPVVFQPGGADSVKLASHLKPDRDWCYNATTKPTQCPPGTNVAAYSPLGTHPLVSGEAPTCTPADANSDGSINISDVQTCINVILGTDTIESHRTCSDVNGGGVNITDCQGIINKILNP